MGEYLEYQMMNYVPFEDADEDLGLPYYNYYQVYKSLVNQKPKQTKQTNSMSNTSDKPPVPFSKLKTDYEDGQTVMCIAGTIVSIFDPKKGDSYEYQNATMKDVAGDEMQVTFSKNSQPKTAKGKKVVIRSIKHDTHGWLGIKVQDEDYEKDGEPVHKRVIRVVASAEVTYTDGGSSSGSGSGGSSSGGGQAPSGQSRSSAPSDVHPEIVLADTTAFHQRCRHYAAQAYTIGTEPGNVSQEEFQAYVSSIFIEGCRQGAQYSYQERALKPIPPKILPPPSPDKWETCMIPKGSLTGKTLGELTDEQLTAFYDAIMEGRNPNGPFGLCVQAGSKARGLIKSSDTAALEPDGDDIPF